MDVEFDPAKDRLNRRKHGLSLQGAEGLDERSAMFDVDDSQDYGEVRYNAVGWLNGQLHTMTFTSQGDSFEPLACDDQPRRSRGDMRNSLKEREPVPDAENPEWTEEKFARAKRFHELPLELQAVLSRKRGPQKAPTKSLISIRLSPDVLEALRAKGRGWQVLADGALRERFVTTK